MNYLKLFRDNKDLNIIDEMKLKEYIDFCIHNNSTSSDTVKHHILPKCEGYFPEYKNLKKFPKNCSNLSREQHAIAHSLLHKSIKCHKMAYAFYNTLISIDKHTEYEHIRKNAWYSWANSLSENGKTNLENSLYNAKQTKIQSGYYKEWGLIISNEMNSKVIFEGEEITKSKMVSIKGIRTKNTTINENGETIQESITRKAQEKMKEVIGENGETRQELTTKKMIATKNSIGEDGKTVFQKTGEKVSQRMKEKLKLNDDTITTVGEFVSRNGRNKVLEMKKDDSLTHIFEGEKVSFNDFVGKQISKTKQNKTCIFRGKEMSFKEKNMIKNEENEIRKKEKELSKKFYIIVGDYSSKVYLRSEISKICQGLLKSSKDLPLGSSTKSKIRLNKEKKLNMIGWYIIEMTRIKF